MSLTKPIREINLDRARRDPDFRAALLGQAVECIIENDLLTAKKMIRDYVLAAMGFPALAKAVGKSPPSLMRMLSEKGNPKLSSLAAVLSAAKEHEGIELEVHSSLKAG